MFGLFVARITLASISPVSSACAKIGERVLIFFCTGHTDETYPSETSDGGEDWEQEDLINTMV